MTALVFIVRMRIKIFRPDPSDAQKTWVRTYVWVYVYSLLQMSNFRSPLATALVAVTLCYTLRSRKFFIHHQLVATLFYSWFGGVADSKTLYMPK